MTLKRVVAYVAAFLMMWLAPAAANAAAANAHDRTQFGHDISIGPDEEVTEATCFGCSIRVRGRVQGDVTTFGGNITVEDQANVGGDTTSFGGNVRLEKGAKVSEVVIFAGRLHRDPAATVNGDVTTFTGSVWLFVIFGLPFLMLGGLIALIVWLVRRLTRAPVPAAA